MSSLPRRYRPSLLVAGVLLAVVAAFFIGVWSAPARAQLEAPVLIQPRWEYKVVGRTLLLAPVVRELTRDQQRQELTPEAQAELSRRLQGMLNEQGAQGWELILASHDDLIFRRRIG